MRSHRVAWQVVLLLCGAVAASSAQSTSATLFGTVVDAQGAVVAGAAITARNLATSQQRAATSDAAGRFSILGLAPGSYEVQIELTGFVTPPRTITLTVAQETRVDAVLQLAAFREQVSVPAAPSVIDASRTTLGHTIVRDEIDRLPVAGRDFASLALLTPGILANLAGNVVASSGIVTAGQTGRSNTFLLDGASLDDNFQANARGAVPLDAVREFAVFTDGYAAQFGQASGAIVSVVTLSGTNDYKGSVAYLIRDDRLDADSPAVRLVASSGRQPVPFEQKVPAFSIGGPIQRDRAFFFGALEGTLIDSASVTTSRALLIYRPGVSPVSPWHSSRWQAFARADRPVANGQLTAHYRIDGTAAPGPNSGGALSPESRNDGFLRDQEVDVTHRRARSTSENEFSSQIARRHGGFDRGDYCSGTCPLFSEIRPSITLGAATADGIRGTETYWQMRDQFSMTRASRVGEHAITVGGNAILISGQWQGIMNQRGTFQFNTDTPFSPDDSSTYPANYKQVLGNPDVNLGHALTAAFAQDRWRPTGTVTINGGLRWDYDSLVGVSRDWNNLAPRLGVAFTPSKSGRTTLRGNYGIYFDQAFEVIVRNYRQAQQTRQLVILNPGYPDPGTQNTNSSQPQSPPDTRRLADLETPSVQRATAGIQHLVGSVSLSIDGVWGRGRNLLETFDANAPGVSGRRPDSEYRLARVVESTGHSWYRGLYIGATKRYTRGYSFSTAYTLSSAQRDTEELDFTPQDQHNPAGERGPALSDVRHQLVGSGAARLPLDVQIGALVTLRSGAPYNITTGLDDNHDGTFNDRPPGVTRNSARGSGFFQLDVRLVKPFPLGRVRIEISGEAFNVTNHANWSGYAGNKNSATGFGRPTTAGIGRQVQLGAHLKF